MKKMKKTLAIIFPVMLICGCSFTPIGSSDFGCPGMPKGVVCKTPRQVYNITTNNGDGIKDGGNKSSAFNPGPIEVIVTNKSNNELLEPMPILVQAQAMRVWIAPWTDQNKDQHWPGLIFTVIQPHQWNIGDDTFEGVEPPVPHRISSGASLQSSSQDVPNTEAVPEPLSQEEILN
jgi:conjugal transfer pilus assembly protein TraV